jgi:hypothetical protein
LDRGKESRHRGVIAAVFCFSANTIHIRSPDMHKGFIQVVFFEFH